VRRGRSSARREAKEDEEHGRTISFHSLKGGGESLTGRGKLRRGKERRKPVPSSFLHFPGPVQGGKEKKDEGQKIPSIEE